MSFIKKVVIGIIVVGFILAVISVFGNPFHFAAWVSDWLVYCVDAVKNIFTGSKEFNDIAKTRPGDIAVIIAPFLY